MNTKRWKNILLESGGKNLDEPTQETLAKQADQHVADRSSLPVFFYFLCYLAMALFSSFGRSYPALAFCFVGVSLFLGGYRLYLARKMETIYTKNSSRWRWLFSFSVYSQALVYAVYVVLAIAFFGFDFVTLVLILGLFAINSGIGESLAPRVILAKRYLLVMNVPVIIACFATGGFHGILLGVVVAGHVIYQWLMIARVGRQFLSSLVHKTLAEIQQTNQIFFTVVENSPNAILVTDNQPTVVYANPAFLKLTGFKLEELVGVHPWMLMNCENDRRLFHEINKKISAGEVWRGDSKSARKDGSIFYHNTTISPVKNEGRKITHYVALTQDITATRAAEEQLRRTRRDFKQLIEKNPNGVAIFCEERIVYVNPTWVTWLGYESASELMGKTIDDFFSYLSEESLDKVNTQNKNDQHRIFGFYGELKLKRKDGEEVVLDVAPAELILFENVPSMMSVARDITERIQMEERLRLADRMVSVGTLAAGVAHEINNPLTFLISNLDFISEEMASSGLPEEQSSALQEALDECRQGADRVRVIVKGLKAFSRGDEKRVDKVDAHKILETSITMVFNEIRHRAQLFKEYGEIDQVLANEAQLSQVFVNLLINAAQSIEEGKAEQNKIFLRTYSDSQEWIVIEIEDTGAGIPEELAKRIFDPFFTTKPVGQGTGLGLTICHNLVANMGGTLTFESKKGQGTTFTLKLPPAGTWKVDLRLQPKRAVSSEARAKILVVDDEPFIGKSLRRIFKGHEIITADSGKEAIDILQRETFDVVFCDLMMPDLTGMDLYKEVQLKKMGIEDRIVFMSGGAFTPWAEEFLQKVPNPCVLKPFDIEGLQALVSEITNTHR